MVGVDADRYWRGVLRHGSSFMGHNIGGTMTIPRNTPETFSLREYIQITPTPPVPIIQPPPDEDDDEDTDKEAD